MTDRRVAVLHVVHSTQRRGAEVFGVDLSHALAEHGVSSPTVALVEGRRSAHRLPLEALGRRSLAPTTLWALRRHARQADVVVAHGSRTLPACAVALAGSGTPFVYRSIGDPASWSATGLRRVRTAAFLRRAARVVTFWPDARDTFAARHGVPACKLAVILKGVPLASHPVPDGSARVAARAAFGLPAEVPVVAFVGALSPEKRAAAVVDAVAGLPNVHLLVAGDGPERPAVEARAARVAPGRVHCVGTLPGSGQAFATADVVALASRTEGMPGVLIEAGLAARPCVATAVGGVPSIIEHGVTGLLIPAGDDAALADALRALLASPERAALMGAAARQRCTRDFDMTTVAAAWADLLTTVVEGAGGASPQYPL